MWCFRSCPALNRERVIEKEGPEEVFRFPEALSIDDVLFISPWFEGLLRALPRDEDTYTTLKGLRFVPYLFDAERKALFLDRESGLPLREFVFGDPDFFDRVYQDWMVRRETLGNDGFFLVGVNEHEKPFRWMTWPPVHLDEEERKLVRERFGEAYYLSLHPLDAVSMMIDMKIFDNRTLGLEAWEEEIEIKDHFVFPEGVTVFESFREAYPVLARTGEGLVTILAAYLKYPELVFPVYAMLVKREDLRVFSFYSRDSIVPLERIPLRDEDDLRLLFEIEGILRCVFEDGQRVCANRKMPS